MKLYDLTQDLKDLEEKIEIISQSKDLEGDSLLVEMKQVRNQIQEMLESKSTGLLSLMRNWDSDLEAIDGEIKRLQTLKKQVDKKKTNLKNWVLMCLDSSGIKDVKTPLGKIYTRNNQPALVINSDDLIPDEFKQVVETVEIDKTRIKDKLKAGEKIQGAELVVSRSVIFPKAKKE